MSGQGDLFSMPPKDPLDIPEFLQRRPLTPAQLAARKREQAKASEIEAAKRRLADEAIFAKRREVEARKRLTNDERERLAFKIDAAVRAGHDTFGKLRKHLGVSDRDLRAGLREALKPDKRGHSLLTISGRTYRPAETKRPTG